MHLRMRPLAVAAAALSLVTAPMASAAEQAGALTIAEAAGKYAPVIYLHPSETLLPMSAAGFVKSSRLQWHHDKCGDADGTDEQDVATSPVAGPLGRGEYRHQAKTSLFTGCRHSGREYASNEDIRPRDSIVGGGEGMYLNLANSLHGGQGTKAPVYWAAHGKSISYWFSYAYSQSNVDNRPDAGHEGDWEHITVLLGAGNRAERVYYAAHNGGCLIAAEGRPVVYAAKGSHGSYPAPGTYRHDTPYGTIVDAAAKGAIWDSTPRLRWLGNEDWYGYGGGWGEVGEIKELTGPQGPHPAYKQGLPAAGTPPC